MPIVLKEFFLAHVHILNAGIIVTDSHADIEDGEVDPELVVPHLPQVDQVLLAAGVWPGAHIGHLMIVMMLHRLLALTGVQ